MLQNDRRQRIQGLVPGPATSNGLQDKLQICRRAKSAAFIFMLQSDRPQPIQSLIPGPFEPFLAPKSHIPCLGPEFRSNFARNILTNTRPMSKYKVKTLHGRIIYN